MKTAVQDLSLTHNPQVHGVAVGMIMLDQTLAYLTQFSTVGRVIFALDLI